MIGRSTWMAPRAILFAGVALAVGSPHLEAVELQSVTIRAWNAYVQATERRIAEELSSNGGFLALDFQSGVGAALERQAVRRGEIAVKKMITVDERGGRIPVQGGLVHHWRGSVFIPGADLDAILSRTANPSASDTRQEDVLQSSVLERGPDFFRIYLKLQRSKFITVVYNTEHTVRIRRYGKTRASSRSVATRISELDMPNSDREREKPEGQDRGFLWRLNSYWRYEQVPGGVIVECESITLSRTVPALLEPIVCPLIDSTARESMQRTLGSMRERLALARPANDVAAASGKHKPQ